MFSVIFDHRPRDHLLNECRYSDINSKVSTYNLMPYQKHHKQFKNHEAQIVLPDTLRVSSVRVNGSVLDNKRECCRAGVARRRGGRRGEGRGGVITGARHRGVTAVNLDKVFHTIHTSPRHRAQPYCLPLSTFDTS